MNETVRRIQGPVTEAVYLEADVVDAGVWARLRRRLGSIKVQFALIVALPTVLAGLYFGLFVSPRYVAEAEYIVRGVTANRATGLSALLTSFGISRTADDTSAIEAFLQSRNAVAQLNDTINLRTVFGREGVDFASRYPRFWQRDNFESLYETTQDFISVIQDPTKGITTLRVATFAPEDSLALARTLLEIGERRVNEMNARAQADAIKNATDEVARAEKDVTTAQTDLTTFRNQELLVDPTSFSTVLLDAISKMSVDLAQTTANIKETLQTSASNPVISSLQARADSLDARIKAEREKLGGSKSALADKMTSYEHMTLMRDMAGKRYASALSTLDSARQEARRQQIYIEEIVQPSLPDEATEPRGFRSTMTVFVLCFAAFAMIWILTVGAKDHAQ